MADAHFIAENVLRALHIEETDEQHIEHLAGISSREDTLYSWRNATIALCDGVPAGLMVAYDDSVGAFGVGCLVFEKEDGAFVEHLPFI